MKKIVPKRARTPKRLRRTNIEQAPKIVEQSAAVIEPTAVETASSKDDGPSLCEALTALRRPGATEWNAAIQEAVNIAKEFDARIAAALAELHADGKYTGGWKPYGYKLGFDAETLEKVDHEQRAIARVRALRAANPKISLRAIAQQLEEEDDLVARSGTRFQPTQINRMLREGVK